METFTLLLSKMTDTLYLDGLCAMCTRSGHFLSRRLAKELKLSELQSPEGEETLEKNQITADTVILVRNGKAYIRSAAGIRCLLYMRWNWRWMFPFAWLVPLPLRDLVYILIAKMRHSLSKTDR